MNRTLTVLGLAALLALLAALFGGDGWRPSPTPAGPVPSHGEAPTPSGRAPSAGLAEAGGIRLHAQLTHPRVPTGTTEAFLVVTLSADDAGPTPRRPLHMTLVLDRSASMAGPRMRHAREAARRVIRGLAETDHLTIVHYGSEAVALPALRADADGRAQMLAFVDTIEAEGGTNLEAALHAVTDVGAAPQRVLLISDGQPTVGEVEPDALITLARRMRGQGHTLSTLGVGEEFNEALLAELARTGDGTYTFVQEGAALPERVSTLHADAAHAVAQSLRIALTPGPHVELLEVLGHPLERHGEVAWVRLPGLAAGASTHFVARLRVHAAGPADALRIAALKLEVREAGAGRTHEALTAVTADHAPSRAVADHHRDPALTLRVAQALAAKNTDLAADALATYRPDEADAYLADTRALLSSLTGPDGALPAPGVVGLHLLEEDLLAQEALARKAMASGGGLGASGSIKSLRSAAQRGYGLPGGTP